LLFQALDNKKECRSVYIDGSIKDQPRAGTLTRTWAPTTHFFDTRVEYAQIWCDGKSLNEVCPPEIKARWTEINARAKAYINSLNNAQVDLKQVCIYDMLPEQFLCEFYDLKNQICASVFETCERPTNYDFMHDLLIFLKKMESKSLNVQIENLNFSDIKVRQSVSKIKNSENKIMYNPWATATGRLATRTNSFPILTLNKDLRSSLEPNNDLFVELDYNSAELRVLLGLLGQDQPEEDIHTWVSSNIFSDKYDRDQVKKKVFAWLYNPKARNKKLNQHFDREKVHNLFYKNGKVMTPYNRELEVVSEKAVNYLVQSTASDLFLTSAIKISKMLEGRKSYIAFCIHDSLVIDFAAEDRPIVKSLVEKFSETKFGKFKTNFSMGRNFGGLEKIV